MAAADSGTARRYLAQNAGAAGESTAQDPAGGTDKATSAPGVQLGGTGRFPELGIDLAVIEQVTFDEPQQPEQRELAAHLRSTRARVHQPRNRWRARVEGLTNSSRGRPFRDIPIPNLGGGRTGPRPPTGVGHVGAHTPVVGRVVTPSDGYRPGPRRETPADQSPERKIATNEQEVTPVTAK